MPQQPNISQQHPTNEHSEMVDTFLDLLATIAAEDVLKALNE